jgi:S1-C subfamily serine protease
MPSVLSAFSGWRGINVGVKLLKHLSFRAIAAAALVGVVAAVAASLALASRSSATAIGTGVVAVRTTLGYEGGAAAGTGVVLTSNGKVLTNNHVIRGATSIRIVVPQTGRSYQAKVVGYDVADDVAVLQANGASHLATATIGNSSTLHVGQQVIATGNALGSGRLTSVTGRITGLGRTITAGDELNGTEQLTGLIETNAALQPGDSGGPLYDGAHRVVAINTAASVGFAFESTAATDAYAIPINRALSIAKQIDTGRSTARVHVGGTPFLGVRITDGGFGFGDGAGGGLVADVVSGSPASRAGLVPGDVITAVAGRAISSSADVVTALFPKTPGSTVKLTWIDQLGGRHTATVTLASGPAL